MLIAGRMAAFVLLIALSAMILYFSWRGKRTGKIPYIRKIAALDAIEEGVGRATEQGRPVLWTCGITLSSRLYTSDGVQLLAGINILYHVARLCAKLRARLLAATGASELIPPMEEAIRLGYLKEGKDDASVRESIQYFPEQAFTVGIVSLMQREKVAAGVYAGPIAHDAVILAETGNAVGAFQVAGSGSPNNIPFLVACCDFTMIGEELFVAGAFISEDPVVLGGILGEDIGKVIALTLSVIGIALISVGANWMIQLLNS